METRSVPEFDSVVVSNGLELRLHFVRSAEHNPTLEISGEPNRRDLLRATVKERTLHVTIDDGAGGYQAPNPIIVSADVTEIHRIRVMGTRAELSGAAERLEITALAGAVINAEALRLVSAEVDLEQSRVTICASERVAGFVAYGATLTVLGGADTTGVSTSNAGSVVVG